MSLAVALGLVALVVLAGLAVHGWWSARRAAPRRAAVMEATPTERVEPTLGPASPAVPAASASVLRRGARIDPLIDAVATLALDAPLTGETVLAHLPASRRAGGKPFHVEGLNTETGEWELPLPDTRYGELQAGVQLANRTGALNEIEYSEFVQKIQAFADAVGAAPDFPDMLDVVARARELDGFASPHDVTLIAQLQARSAAWSVGYLRQCAERHGFVPGSLPGRLVLPADEEGAPPLLVLSFDAQAALSDDPQQASVRQIALALDVAQTPESAEPFAAWQQSIRSLSNDMDAVATDDEGHPITLQHYSTIAGELKTLYRALESRDMAAGSMVARRLFQ